MKVALIIVLFIVSVIVLFLISNIKLTVYYSKEVKVKVNYLFLTVFRYPKPKKQIKFSDFTYENTHKVKYKDKKKSAKRRSSIIKANTENIIADPVSTIKSLAALLKKLSSIALKYSKVKLAKIHIIVSTDDAAKTAILYGVVSQTVAYITGIINEFTNVAKTKGDQISVKADFIAGECKYDIKIVFSLKIWQSLDILIKLFYNYLKQKRKNADISAMTEDKSNG